MLIVLRGHPSSSWSSVNALTLRSAIEAMRNLQQWEYPEPFFFFFFLSSENFDLWNVDSKISFTKGTMEVKISKSYFYFFYMFLWPSSQELLTEILKFQLKKTRLKFVEPWEWKFQKATPPTIFILLEPYLSYMFPMTVITKVAHRNFKISNCIFKKEI